MEFSEFLEKQAQSIQALWQSSAEEHADWKKYLLRYYHESLRWLVAVAVAVLGISQFSPSASATPWHSRGRIVLIVFVVGSILFDKWRSERAWKKQVADNDFTNQKLGSLRGQVGEWQENEAAKKLVPDAVAVHHHVNSEIIAWHKGRTPSCLEQIGDWLEGKLEFLALLCFVVGVTMYFLP